MAVRELPIDTHQYSLFSLWRKFYAQIRRGRALLAVINGRSRYQGFSLRSEALPFFSGRGSHSVAVRLSYAALPSNAMDFRLYHLHPFLPVRDFSPSCDSFF